MSEAYDAFARRVVADGVITDPWLDGEPRLTEVPLILEPAEHAALLKVGAEVAEVYDEACRLVDDDPTLLDDFFALTPVQKLMWNASRPLWHGIARADVFVTRDGHAIAELNSDTPTGEAEAVVLSRLAKADHPDLLDPNDQLKHRFGAMIEAMFAGLVEPGAPRTAGIVYPTEFTEDLGVIRLYRTWLTEIGFEVVLGSPYNLGLADGRATLFGRPLGAMVRHYKTDGWGERTSAWDDETLPDALPLAAPLESALRASVENRTVAINPFGAIVPQNKRVMAFMWEHIHRFSTRGRALIERYVPWTSRLETLHPERLLAERDRWVLKSDYGAEGEEVIIGRETDPATWSLSLQKARPGRWIAQSYFEALPDPREKLPLNFGVFVIAGDPCGIYVRRQAGATNDHAVSVPVLVKPQAAVPTTG